MTAKTVELSWAEVHARALSVSQQIRHTDSLRRKAVIRAYPVPNGGISAALSVQHAFNSLPPERWSLERSGVVPQGLVLTDGESCPCDVIIDDIIDSGATRKKLTDRYPVPFFALVDKQGEDRVPVGVWYSFPWERMQKDTPSGPEDNIRRLIQFIGDDPAREGLADTPKRVVKAMNELYGGYKQDPADCLTTFEEKGYDEMVVLRDMEFVSHCEHHMLPFYGKAAVGYIPNGRVIGISKLARLFEIYARRLQIQERLCMQVTDALNEHLMPRAAGCVIEARHMCMVCRGVRKQHSVMTTSSLTGIFKHDAACRAEFLKFVS